MHGPVHFRNAIHRPTKNGWSPAALDVLSTCCCMKATSPGNNTLRSYTRYAIYGKFSNRFCFRIIRTTNNHKKIQSIRKFATWTTLHTWGFCATHYWSLGLRTPYARKTVSLIAAKSIKYNGLSTLIQQLNCGVTMPKCCRVPFAASTHPFVERPTVTLGEILLSVYFNQYLCLCNCVNDVCLFFPYCISLPLS